MWRLVGADAGSHLEEHHDGQHPARHLSPAGQHRPGGVEIGVEQAEHSDEGQEAAGPGVAAAHLRPAVLDPAGENRGEPEQDQRQRVDSAPTSSGMITPGVAPFHIWATVTV